MTPGGWLEFVVVFVGAFMLGVIGGCAVWHAWFLGGRNRRPGR